MDEVRPYSQSLERAMASSTASTAVVGESDGFVDGLEGRDGKDRAECLLLHDAGVLPAAAQNRGLVVIAGLAFVSGAAALEPGAIEQRDLDRRAHQFKLFLADQGAHLRGGVEGIADNRLLHGRRDSSRELRSSGLLDVDTF